MYVGILVLILVAGPLGFYALVVQFIAGFIAVGFAEVNEAFFINVKRLVAKHEKNLVRQNKARLRIWRSIKARHPVRTSDFDDRIRHTYHFDD